MRSLVAILMFVGIMGCAVDSPRPGGDGDGDGATTVNASVAPDDELSPQFVQCGTEGVCTNANGCATLGGTLSHLPCGATLFCCKFD